MVAGFVAAENGDAGGIEEGLDGVDLADGAIKDDEVGVVPFFVLEAAFDDLTHTGEVVLGVLLADFELAILGAVAGAIGENDHTGDGIGAGLVRDVVAFNTAGWALKLEELLELFEGLVAGDVEEFFVGKDDFLFEFAQAKELVAQFGGLFVVPCGGGKFHLLFKVLEELLAAALEVANEFAEVLFVFLGSGFADFDAGGETEVGVEGLFAVVGLVVIRKNLAEDAEGLGDGAFGVEGADVAGVVAGGLASDGDGGDFGLEVDAHVADGLVVAEEDVPLGHIALDHFGFEEEGVHFSINYDPVGVGDFVDECGGLGVFLGVLKILADAVFENGGLANINNLTFGVFMEINAGSGGEGLQLGFLGA